MLEEEKVYLSAVEAMAVLGWKKSKVYYWISSGKFEIVKQIDGDKIVLTPSEIEKLKEFRKVSEKSENYEPVEEIPETSEEVQKIPVQNVTENYKTFQNNTNSETFELLNKSIEAIKQMYLASSQNYNYSLKLLTDGQSTIEKENIELKQEKKAVEENLKHFEKVSKIKNIIITILSLLLILSTIFIILVLNNLVQFENVQNKNIEQTQSEVMNE